MTTTTVSIPPARLEEMKAAGIAHRASFWRGLLSRDENFQQWRRFAKSKQAGPLSPKQVEELTAFQDQMGDSFESRSREFDVTKDAADSADTRYHFAALLAELLRDRPDIRSAANIGARIDHFSAYLAMRFPQVQCFSVDFQSELARHNSLLPQASNWHFLSGYWLDLMRTGKLRCELYFAISTTVLMNNGEINAFLDQAAQHAKAIALCEPWWTIGMKGRLFRPEEIAKENPRCGGAYANYHHNYIAKLEERGFKVSLSQIVPYSTFSYLQIVATRPQTSSQPAH